MLFDTLLALTNDAVFIDRHGVIIAANEAGAEIYGFESVEAIVGQEIVDLVPAEHHQEILERESLVASGFGRERWSNESIVRADGVVRQVRVRSAAILYEDELATLVVMRPLLATRDPEQEIRERRLQTFVETSLQLATVVDGDLDEAITAALRSIAISEGADRAYIIGFDEGGRTVSCSHEWCGPGISALKAYYQQLPFAGFPWSTAMHGAGQTLHVSDLRLTPPEAGPERQLFGQHGVRSLLQVPMFSAGRVVGLVGFNSIHRHVAWPESSIELVRWVGGAIAAALHRRRTACRLIEAERRAVAASEAKSTFLTRTSHELRTPLNAVLGFTELMLLDKDRSEQDKDHLRQIVASSTHLLNVVEDLLDLGRVETGQLPVTLAPVPTQPVLDAAVAMISSAHLDDELTLRLEPAAEPLLTVLADYQRLQQVLVNLISNACKYNVAGGEVNVRSVIDEQDFVVIEVADTGIGIPEHLLDRVYQPFDRLGREESSTPGTGIGLALTKHLVEAMGGTMTLTSTEGEGTTVAVRLPRAQMDSEADLHGGAVSVSGADLHGGAEAAANAEPGSYAENGRAGWRVDGQATPSTPTAVVVESSEASGIVICHVLRAMAGFEPVWARSASEGLQLVVERRPDLLVLENTRSDESGEALLRALCRELGPACPPTLVVTANADPAAIERLWALGVADVVLKPAGLSELLGGIETAVGGTGRVRRQRHDEVCEEVSCAESV